MNRPYPLHPFQLAIELAWDRGATPRILVLADREGVVLPDHVVARFEGVPVPIDLDPSFPLAPAFYAESCVFNLAFAGHVQVCRFPWKSILAVTDLSTGEGFVRMVPKEQKRTAVPVDEAEEKFWKKESGSSKPGVIRDSASAEKGLKPLTGFKPRVIDGGKKED